MLALEIMDSAHPRAPSSHISIVGWVWGIKSWPHKHPPQTSTHKRVKYVLKSNKKFTEYQATAITHTKTSKPNNQENH